MLVGHQGVNIKWACLSSAPFSVLQGMEVVLGNNLPVLEVNSVLYTHHMYKKIYFLCGDCDEPSEDWVVPAFM